MAAMGAALGSHPYDRNGNKRTGKERASTAAKSALILGAAGTAWSAGGRPLLNRFSKKPPAPRPMEREQLLELHPTPKTKTAGITLRNLKRDLINVGVPTALFGGLLGLLPSHKRDGKTWRKKRLGERLKTTLRGATIGGLLGTGFLTANRGLLEHIEDVVDAPRPPRRPFSFELEPRPPLPPPPGGFGRLSNIDPPTPPTTTPHLPSSTRSPTPSSGTSSSGSDIDLDPRPGEGLDAFATRVLDDIRHNLPLSRWSSSLAGNNITIGPHTPPPAPVTPHVDLSSSVNSPGTPIQFTRTTPLPEIDPSVARFSNLDLEGGPTMPRGGKSKKAAIDTSCVDAFVDEIGRAHV